MSDFKDTLQQLLNTDDQTKIELACDSFVKLMPVFKEIDPEHDGFYAMFDILAGSAAADGELSERELYFIQALLNNASRTLGYSDQFSEEEILNIVRTAAGNNVVYDRLRKLSAALNDDLHGEMITFVAAFCAIDDTITASEMAFINDLL